MATINLGSIKFNWKGAYNGSTAYAVDDVVSSGGNSYVCIQASTGNAVGNATAYWNIMSSAGAAGAEGGTTTLTTRGDLLTRGASAVARLAKGTEGQVLGQGANDPAWVNGSAKTLTTQGDILYRDGSGLQRVAKGTAGQVLQMNSAANAPEYATASSGGLEMADQWRLEADITSNTSPITSNFGRIGTAYGSGTLGSAMTESSGVFTFPSTGIYHVTFAAKIFSADNDSVTITIQGSVNNFTSSDDIAMGYANFEGNSTSYTNTLFDCQNTSTHKVRFTLGSINSGSSLRGGSGVNTSYITFLKLGAT